MAFLLLRVAESLPVGPVLIIQLTDEDGSFSNGPDWSPNGKSISFFRCALGFPFTCDLWVMNADGSGEVQLSNTPGDNELDPRWSPNGKQILFSRATPFGPPDLFLMEADGSNVRNITNTPTIWEFSADWSPNGKEIVYEADGDIVRQVLSDGTTANLTQSRCVVRLFPGVVTEWQGDRVHVGS